MHFLHSMIRVRNLAESLDFWCNKIGLVEVHRRESQQGRFTLVFLAAPDDLAAVRATFAAGGRGAPTLELTYNWDSEDYGSARNFGHLAFEVDDIYALCARLQAAGVVIARPPRDGQMAFVRSPDLISVEFLQKGAPLPKKEPWASMPNIGVW